MTHAAKDSLSLLPTPLTLAREALIGVKGNRRQEILAELDLGIVFLESWAQLPTFLLSVRPEETAARGARVRQ